MAGVLAIFNNIEINTTEITGAKIVDFLVDAVEIIALVSAVNFSLQLRGAANHPAIEGQQFVAGNTVCSGIKTIKIRQHKANGIADAAVGISSATQDLIGHRHFTTEIRRGHPQAQYIGTQLVNHLLRSHDIAQRFGHFVAIGIDGKTVGQHRFIGRRAVDGDGRL